MPITLFNISNSDYMARPTSASLVPQEEPRYITAYGVRDESAFGKGFPRRR